MPNIIGPNGSSGDNFETGDLRYWPANYTISLAGAASSASVAVNGTAAQTGSYGVDMKATAGAVSADSARALLSYVAPTLPASGVLSWQAGVQAIAIATASSNYCFPLVYASLLYGNEYVGLFTDGTNFFAGYQPSLGSYNALPSKVGPNTAFSLSTWHKVEITFTVGANEEAWKLTVDDVPWGGYTFNVTTGLYEFGFNLYPYSTGSAEACEMYVDNVYLADGYIG